MPVVYSFELVCNEDIFGNMSRVRRTQHSHEPLQLSGDAQDDATDAGLPLSSEPIENRSSKTDQRSAISKALQNVASPSESAVHQKGYPAFDCRSNLLHDLKRMTQVIQGVGPMVGDNKAVLTRSS
jgi:hypothetical protein